MTITASQEAHKIAKRNATLKEKDLRREIKTIRAESQKALEGQATRFKRDSSVMRSKVTHVELVLDNAEHMAFSDRTLLGRQHRNPNHHKSIQAISTAFWDCYLLGDGEARAWLSGPQVKRRLDEKDIWLSK